MNKFLKVFPMLGFKPILVLLILIIVVGISSLAGAATTSFGNQAEQQIRLEAPPEIVFTLAPEAFKQWGRGEFLSADPSSLTVIGLSRTRFFKFVDDITVQIRAIEDARASELSIQSKGRVGEYDFGGNQRNINEYLATLKSLLEQS